MDGMTIYAAFVAVMLLALGSGLFPRFERGRARNTMFAIRMPDPAAPGIYPGYWRHVYVQEDVEFTGAWLGALFLAFPFAVALSTFTPFGAASPVLALIAWNWRRLGFGARWLEYLGWSAEYLHGSKAGHPYYSTIEFHALRLREYYPDLFRGLLIVEVTRGLRRAGPVARVVMLLRALPIGRRAK